MKKRDHLLKHLQYILVGFLLAINGLNSFPDYFGPALLNMIIGIALIFTFLLVLRKKLRQDYLEPLAMIAEGIGLFIAGYIYFKDGSHYLPYIFYFAGAGYFIAALIRSGKSIKPI